MGLFRNKNKPDYTASQQGYALQVEEGALKLWSGEQYFRSSLFRREGQEEYLEAIRDDSVWRLQKKITYLENGTTSVKAGRSKLKYFEALHEVAMYEATQFAITGNADFEKIEEDLAGTYFKDVAHNLNIIFNCEGMPRMTRNGYAIGQDEFPAEELALLDNLRKAELEAREQRRLEAEKQQQEAQREAERKQREAEEEKRRKESLPVVISWGDGETLNQIFNTVREEAKADPSYFVALLDVRSQINALEDFLIKFRQAVENYWNNERTINTWVDKGFPKILQRLQEACERNKESSEPKILLDQLRLVTRYYYTALLAQFVAKENSGTGLSWNGSGYDWFDTAGNEGHIQAQRLFRESYADLEILAAERFSGDINQQRMLLLSVMETREKEALQKTLNEIISHLEVLKKTVADYSALGLRRGLEGLEPPPLLVEGSAPQVKSLLPENKI